jgi:hypothetical protein
MGITNKIPRRSEAAKRTYKELIREKMVFLRPPLSLRPKDVRTQEEDAHEDESVHHLLQRKGDGAGEGEFLKLAECHDASREAYRPDDDRQEPASAATEVSALP